MIGKQLKLKTNHKNDDVTKTHAGMRLKNKVAASRLLTNINVKIHIKLRMRIA